MALETERAFYNAHRDEYRGKYYNKFLVISGEKLWGVFADESDAVDYGVEQFDTEYFMIHSPSWEDEKKPYQPWRAALYGRKPAPANA